MMPKLTDSDLRDPTPPVPGDKERTAVAARAHQLGRRRRMMQGAGALGMVAALAVGVAALTAGGTSPGSGGHQIEAASSAGATDTTDAGAAVTTTVPAAVTTVPAPAPETTPAPDASASEGDTGAVEAPSPAPDTTPAAPAAPSTYTVSGTVSNIPEGVILTLTLSGSGGTFSAIADGAGNFSISGIPAGTYDASYSWESTDHTASQVGKLGGVTINSDSTVSFSLP
jgi:hypothetical protein